MNAEVKQKWLDALRSGEYKQAKSALRNGDGYCCLGVLCDLHAKATGHVWGDEDEYLGQCDLLPKEVCDWAELVSDQVNEHGENEFDISVDSRLLDDNVVNEYTNPSLAGLNDEDNDFPTIAAIIEKQL